MFNKDTGKYERSWITELKLNEVSGVDDPANPHAKVVIFKSKSGTTKPTAEVLKAARVERQLVAKGIIALLKDDGGAETFDEMLIDQTLRQQISSFLYVLEDSVRSILCDDTLGGDEKTSAIGISVGQFLAELEANFPSTTKRLAKLLKENPATAAIFGANTEDDTIMKTAEQIAAEIKKGIEDGVAAATAPLTKQLEALTLDAAKGKLTPDQRDYFDLIQGEAAQAEFLKAEDKAAFMKSKPLTKRLGGSDEETITIGSETIRKSVIGEGPFAIIKMQQNAIGNLTARVVKAEDTSVLKALEGEVAKTFGALPGTDADKAVALKALRTLDAGVIKTLEAMLLAGDKAMASKTKEQGAGGDHSTAGDAETQLNELAKSYAKENKVTFEKAYEAVCKTETGTKLYGEFVKQAQPGRAA